MSDESEVEVTFHNDGISIDLWVPDQQSGGWLAVDSRHFSYDEIGVEPTDDVEEFDVTVNPDDRRIYLHRYDG